MICANPRCLGNYDFDRIVHFAIKRFVDGMNTIELLGMAKSEQEKEEIVMVSLLHLDDDAIGVFNLSCECEGNCKAIICRNRLKTLINKKLAK
jgi:hypothetical protein